MRRSILLITTLILLVNACTSKQSTPTLTAAPTPITVTDALGRQVTLPSAPQRIVITGKALFMIIDAVYTFPDARDRIVGMGSADQGISNFISLIDPQYSQKAVLESGAGAEQIAALKPDLVILKSYLAESVGTPIEAIGIPVIYVDFETPEQYTRDLTILGQALQMEARAAELNAYYQAKIDSINKAVASVTEKPRILMLSYSDKDGTVAFKVPPLSWMQTQIVQMAGGEPVWGNANLSNNWTQVTLEQIAAWNADQIFVISYNSNSADVVTRLKANSTWQQLRAVQESKLYAFPGDLYSWDQPDTRWILGLTWLAGCLHPEQFSDMNIITEAQTFYQTLYGLDNTFFEKNIRPTFKGNIP